MVRTKGSKNTHFNYEVMIGDNLTLCRTLNDLAEKTGLSISTCMRKIKDNKYIVRKYRNIEFDIRKVYKPRFKMVEIYNSSSFNL